MWEDGKVGSMSRLIKHIRSTLLLVDGDTGNLMNPITSNMFNIDDIKDIRMNKNDEMFMIEFHGLNGIIPIRFFDDKSKQKLSIWLSSRNSPLWKVLNNTIEQ